VYQLRDIPDSLIKFTLHASCSIVRPMVNDMKLA